MATQTGSAYLTIPRERSGVAGMALAAVGLTVASFVILLGIITAEALYPATYTTHDNEISDLGATRPPDSIIRQPSARIFNATMLASGAMIIASAVALRAGGLPKRAFVALGLMGIGVFGVGVFPGNYAPHGIFAMLAFVAGGLSAILAGTTMARPVREISIAMGVATLGSLAVAMVGDLTPIWDEMGDGGVERWVAYPVVIWLGVYGGYLGGQRAA
jgi:hypothetical membrane protein